MKALVFITILAALFGQSYYSIPYYRDSLVYGQWGQIKTFETVRDGVTTFDNGVWYLNGKTAKVIGKCQLKRDPQGLKMRVDGLEVNIKHTKTGYKFTTFVDSDFVIEAQQFNQQAANGIKCTIVVKGVR